MCEACYLAAKAGQQFSMPHFIVLIPKDEATFNQAFFTSQVGRRGMEISELETASEIVIREGGYGHVLTDTEKPGQSGGGEHDET